MKKTFLWLAGAAMLLASCSESDSLLTSSTSQNASRVPVEYGVYTNNTQLTRAGYPGDVDLATLKATGFGVYGYVAENYASTGLKPDFMWNERVAFNGTSWASGTVKYWPNQADASGAGVDDLKDGTAINSGDKINRVSFFAYAPFVSESELTYGSIAEAQTNADGKTGITYITKSNEAGDPKVVYQVSNDPAKGVDLMYGVAARNYDGATEFIGMDTKTVTEGLPFIDMTKQTVDGKLEYKFRHALTKLLVDVDGYFDEDRLHGTTHDNEIDINTRVMIESVTITSDGLSTGGVLNLNNTVANQPKWEDADANKLSGEYSLQIADNLKHRPATDGVDYFGSQLMGVTKTAQPLFNTTGTGMMFVPTEGTTNNMTVKIVYYVITRDSRLEKGYSVVKNTISNTVEGFAFEAGKANKLHLHIGLTSVKFDAEVVDWDTTSGPEEDIDVPLNIKPETAATTTTDEAGNKYVDLGLPSGKKWANASVTGGTSAYSDANYTYYTWAQAPTAIASWSGNDTHVSLPSRVDFQELIANTDNEWTTVDGVSGRKFTNKTDPTKSVFFPAAGYCIGGSVSYAGADGFYWSSTESGKDYAYSLDFDSDYVRAGIYFNKVLGHTVRAVYQ